MSKTKELLVIGAAAASCAAAAAGYSLFKNEDKPVEPKKLIETAKDTVLNEEVQKARAAFEYDEEKGDIIGGEKASIYRGPSDDANIQQWRDTATINQKSGAPSDIEEGDGGKEKSGAPSDREEGEGGSGEKSGTPSDRENNYETMKTYEGRLTMKGEGGNGEKSGAPSDREEGETGSGEKSGAPSDKVYTNPNLTRSRTQDALFRLGR